MTHLAEEFEGARLLNVSDGDVTTASRRWTKRNMKMLWVAAAATAFGVVVIAPPKGLQAMEHGLQALLSLQATSAAATAVKAGAAQFAASLAATAAANTVPPVQASGAKVTKGVYVAPDNDEIEYIESQALDVYSPLATTTTTVSTQSLESTLPPLQDGCEPDEESFGPFCYAKCATLTNGNFPKRNTAFSCCRNACKAVKDIQVHPSLPCSGFDIASPADHKGCPTPKGRCPNPDEEEFMGLCYHSCSSLTNGQYPYRFAAMSCSKSLGWFSRMNPLNDWTNGAFAASETPQGR